jgi:hypothetical protein
MKDLLWSTSSPLHQVAKSLVLVARLKIVGVMEDPTVFSSFLFRACSVKAKNLDQIVLFGQVLYVNYTTRLV